MKSIETINTTPSTQNQHQNSENYWDILDSFASVSAILSEASSVTAKISYQLSKDNESIQQSSAKAFAKKINADESVLNTTQTVMDIVQVVMIGLMISNVATALAGVAVEGSLVQFAKTALPMAANILIPLATGALFANNPSIVGTILKGIIPLGIMGGLHLYQKSLKMGTDEAQAVVGSRIQQGLSATILLFSALEIVEGVMQVQISNATKAACLSLEFAPSILPSEIFFNSSVTCFGMMIS